MTESSFMTEFKAAGAKGYAANNDFLAQFFGCPHVAMGFVQGAIRRALETHGVTLRYKAGATTKKVDGETVGGDVIEYVINGNAVSEYNSHTGPMNAI
jgi:hypothetical protein